MYHWDCSCKHRRKDIAQNCLSADAPSPGLSKRLLKVRGGCSRINLPAHRSGRAKREQLQPGGVRSQLRGEHGRSYRREHGRSSRAVAGGRLWFFSRLIACLTHRIRVPCQSELRSEHPQNRRPPPYSLAGVSGFLQTHGISRVFLQVTSPAASSKCAAGTDSFDCELRRQERGAPPPACRSRYVK